MVTTKLKRPDSFAVSANIINNPPLSFLHYHFGALHPYFPEMPGAPNQNQNEPLEAVTTTATITSWRSSDHPYWEGPDHYEWPLDKDPPSDGHRWLRVQDNKALNRTPVSHLTYDFWGTTYESWAIAAQQHYSLLENLEHDQIDLYRFEPPWDMGGQRIRINALAILGDDILDSDIDNWPKDKGDEDMLVIELPKRFGRRKPISSSFIIVLIRNISNPLLQQLF